MLRPIYILGLIISSACLRAQTISGAWYGRAEVELSGLHNNYLTELVVKQKGSRVEGIFGYYFRDKYQSYFIHGTYNPRTREIIILNLPVIYYGSNSTVNSIDCMTNFRGILIASHLGSTLTGTFYHDGRYKYMCPDLKVNYYLDKGDKSQDSLGSTPALAKIWKPQADDFVVDAAKTGLPAGPEPKATGSAPAVHDTTVVTPGDSMSVRVEAPAKADSVVRGAADATPPKRDSAAIEVTATAVQKTADSLRIAESFAKRKSVLNREFLVESDSVRLSFYDNGEIDGDSISVFVNNELVLSHQGLEAKAFNVYLHLDSTRETNEISMYAENLGRIPPNTALMVITDGINRYEVFLSSSLTENATVELRRKRP